MLVEKTTENRRTEELFTNGSLVVTVAVKPGAIRVKLLRHGPTVELRTRHGETLAQAEQIAQELLGCKSLRSARARMDRKFKACA